MSYAMRHTRLHVLVICVYALFVFAPSLINPGPLLQTDQPLWAAVSHVWSAEVIPSQGWIWGTITDRAGAGQVLGQAYSLSIVLPALLSGLVGVATSVKLSMFASAVAFMVGMFLVASLYLPRRYATIVAMLALNPIFDNLVSGMWYNYASLGFALSFWYLCDGLIREPRVSWRPAAGACLIALTFYSHPVGIVVCLTIWASYFYLGMTAPGVGWKLSTPLFAGMLLCGVLLAAPQVLALLAGAGAAAPRAGETVNLALTSPLEVLRRMTFFRVWGASNPGPVRLVFMAGSVLTVFLFSIYGFYRLARDRGIRDTLPLTAVVLINAVVISKAFTVLVPAVGMGLVLSLRSYHDRFQIVTQVYLSILAVLGIWHLSNVQRAGRFQRVKSAGVAVGALTVTWMLLLSPIKIYVERSGQLDTLGSSAIGDDLMRFWTWARQNVSADRERVYFEDTFGKLHWTASPNPEALNSHAFALTSVYTSIRQIGGWNSFEDRFGLAHEQGGVFGVPFSAGKAPYFEVATDQEIFDEMRLLNCRYVVAISPALRRRLERTEFLALRLRSATFGVFENTRMDPAWAYDVVSGREVRFIRHAPHRFELLTDGKDGDVINVSMAFHPAWRATSDGHPLRIANYKELMQVSLPRDGAQRILFEFSIERRMHLVLFGSGVLLTCMFALWGLRRTG